MKIKLLLIFITLTVYSNNLKIDKYLDSWLKKNDSVLVFDYKTGEILYEYHSYMFDKMIPIGSVFKVVTTFFLLKNKRSFIDNYTHNCKSFTAKEDFDFHCWKKKGHGIMSINSAFVNSCNQFFYSLNLPIIELKKTSKYLGIDLNIDISKLNKKESKLFQAGNLPIIKANFYGLSKLLSIFANKGMLVDIKDSNEAYYIKELEVVVQINKLMREVIEIGTANKVFFKGYGLSGKTGTSKDENGKQNGLFIGFTTDKSYAIIVNLYENIGSTAAMIASDVLYLSNNL